MNFIHRFRIDLVFQSRRDENVHVLFDPGHLWEYLITQFFRFYLVDTTEFIRDGPQFRHVQTRILLESISFLVCLIPIRSCDHFSAQPMEQLDRIL